MNATGCDTLAEQAEFLLGKPKMGKQAREWRKAA